MPTKSSRIINVNLIGYLGLIRVATVVLGRYTDAHEAEAFYQTMREHDTEKVEHIKRCLLEFFDDWLVFCIKKEDHEGPL